MTITKKPRAKGISSTTPAQTQPETFIEGADHPVEASPVVDEPAIVESAPILVIVDVEADHAKKAKQPKDKKKKDKKKDKEKKKEAVLIRFENGQLNEIDSRADGLGLSRAAFVRMAVAQALGKQ